MNETKFTPAPWKKDYGGTVGHIKSIGIKQGGGYKQTPTVCRYDVKTLSLPNEEKEANANLIAASPKLYEALKDALFQMAAVKKFQLETEGGYRDDLLVAIQGAEKVLAEARGENHE